MLFDLFIQRLFKPPEKEPKNRQNPSLWAISKSKWIPFFCLAGTLSLQANELWLTNDSPFPLKAQVFGAAGMYDEQNVAPGTQWHWNNDQEMSGPATDPNVGASTYTVIWYCAKSSQPYGTNTNVIPGSWVFAQSSEGQKICPLPKKVTPNQRQRPQ